jgi:hypothetical protein
MPGCGTDTVMPGCVTVADNNVTVCKPNGDAAKMPEYPHADSCLSAWLMLPSIDTDVVKNGSKKDADDLRFCAVSIAI